MDGGSQLLFLRLLSRFVVLSVGLFGCLMFGSVVKKSLEFTGSLSARVATRSG